MKIGDLDELNAGVDQDGKAVGDECFVIIASHYRSTDEIQRTFKVYHARAARQYMREGHVQVQTEAARNYHQKWRHLSFRQDDGRAIIDRRCARLVVAETMAEQVDLEHRAKVTACPFTPELAMPSSARVLSIAETRGPAYVAPRAPAAFGLFQPPEDFETD